VKLPDGYHGDGENLLSALKGEPIKRTRPVFWEWLGTKAEPDYWPRLVVRDGDWKLVMTDDAKRVELHHILKDRAEASNVAKDNPEIAARLTRLALDWKATLPKGPNPECRSAPSSAPEPEKPEGTSRKVTPEVRAGAFTRWDSDKDDVLTLAEYRAGLKGQDNLESRFKNFDKNGDGKLTREEFVGKSTK
jgi:hypothetical protein